MIILRQKAYSGEDKEGMSTGKKVALGLGATALAAGTAFAGARRGMLGVNAQKVTNTWIAKGGSRLAGSSNETIQGLGNRMMNSGISGYGAAAKTEALRDFANERNLNSVRDVIAAGGNKVGNTVKRLAEKDLRNQLNIPK